MHITGFFFPCNSHPSLPAFSDEHYNQIEMHLSTDCCFQPEYKRKGTEAIFILSKRNAFISGQILRRFSNIPKKINIIWWFRADCLGLNPGSIPYQLYRLEPIA